MLRQKTLYDDPIPRHHVEMPAHLGVTAARRHQQGCVDGWVDAHDVEQRHNHRVDHKPVLLPQSHQPLKEDGVTERSLVWAVDGNVA